METDTKPDIDESDKVFKDNFGNNNAKKLNDYESNPDNPANKEKNVQELEKDNTNNKNSGQWNTDVSNNQKPTSLKFNKVNFLKKKGPLVGIVLSVFGIGAGITGLLTPALAIVHLKEVLSSALSDSTPALSSRTLRIMALKADGVKNSFTESADGKCNIKCKFGTMSDSMKRNFEAKGFKIESDAKFSGRHVIKSLTFPDGHIVTNGKDFSEALKTNSRASDFTKVFDSKTAYFLNTKFGSMLKTKFGLDKLPKLVGNTKEKVISSLRSSLGLEGESAATDPALKLSAEERVRTGRFKGAFAVAENISGGVTAKVGNIVGVACVAYNSAKGISFAVKAKKIAAFAVVAMAVFTVADQIKSGDSPDPAVVSQAGNQLTQVETNQTVTASDGTVSPNAFYNKSTFESAGYQSAVYQNNPGTLSDQELAYSATPVGTLAKDIGKLTGILTGLGGTAIVISHGVCKTASHPVVGAVSGCGPELLGALVSAPETAGLSAVAAAAWCVGKLTVMGLSTGVLVGTIVSKITSAIVNNELPGLDENTVGARQGDAIYTGSAQILGGTSALYGLKPGTKAEISQYVADTASIKQQNDAIARYDAQSTPFDSYNQYSFLGSFINKLGLVPLVNSSLTSNLSTIGSMIPKSFASLVTNTNAVSTLTEATNKSNLYGASPDAGMSSIGVDTDSFGNASYVMSASELNSDSSSVIDYLVKNSDINLDTGETIPGSEYDKYLTNCANRTEPLGETSAAIEDDGYAWKVGLKCTETSTDLSNFRTYTMDKSVNDTMDDIPATIANSTNTQSTGVPSNVTPKGSGWILTDRLDYSAIPCAAGSTDDGLYIHPTRGFTIRKCTVAGGTVASIISQNAVNMFNAAKSAGVDLSLESGFRSYEQQAILFSKNCNQTSGTCRTQTAPPGNSQHEAGIALDLKYNGSTICFNQTSASCTNNAGSNWLKTNAITFGLYNLPSEAWHWSASGN